MQIQKTLIGLGLLITLGVLAGIVGYDSVRQGVKDMSGVPELQEEASASPQVVLSWGDLGVQMTEAGVIDLEKFSALYASRARLPDGQDGLPDEVKTLLTEASTDTLIVDKHNAPLMLNLLWAFGLSNKNSILEEGPMMDPRYNGADRFASTGGWTLAQGGVMDHYSMHPFVTLTAEQQQLVERVSKNIYRPCCNNPTHFPDCNHGMAMLGLLELLAKDGASEEELYRAALTMNTYWFPAQYNTIAQYLESSGTSFESVSPQELLGTTYSSASGFQKVAALIPPDAEGKGGGSCGV